LRERKKFATDSTDFDGLGVLMSDGGTGRQELQKSATELTEFTGLGSGDPKGRENRELQKSATHSPENAGHGF
jgi:hypothetical protein